MRTNSIKISVVMTTYNGELFVVKQLESILNQSRKPDEVIICDDGSKDLTANIVKSFIGSHQLECWHFYQNSPNLGWQMNFYNAAGMATGDIIFFSDQDDIWKKEKIEIMTKMMVENSMGCLYSEKTIIDGYDKVIWERQDKKIYTGMLTRIALSYSFYDIKTLGCCMCVNKKILNTYLRLNFPEGGHDSQCGRLAVLTDSLWHIDYPLINYRIHSNNTSGISGKASFGQSSRTKRIKDIETTKRWIEKIMIEMNLDEEKNQLLLKCQEFLTKRLRYFKNDLTFFHLLFNMKYYRNYTMFCGDIAYKYGFNVTLGKLRWKLAHLL